MRIFRMEILIYNNLNNEHLLYIHEHLAIILASPLLLCGKGGRCVFRGICVIKIINFPYWGSIPDQFPGPVVSMYSRGH